MAEYGRGLDRMVPLASLFELMRGRLRRPDAVPARFAPDELFRPDDSALGNGWLASSIELKHGLEVSEQPMDTLPDELLDAFFKR